MVDEKMKAIKIYFKWTNLNMTGNVDEVVHASIWRYFNKVQFLSGDQSNNNAPLCV